MFLTLLISGMVSWIVALGTHAFAGAPRLAEVLARADRRRPSRLAGVRIEPAPLAAAAGVFPAGVAPVLLPGWSRANLQPGRTGGFGDDQRRGQDALRVLVTDDAALLRERVPYCWANGQHHRRVLRWCVTWARG